MKPRDEFEQSLRQRMEAIGFDPGSDPNISAGDVAGFVSQTLIAYNEAVAKVRQQDLQTALATEVNDQLATLLIAYKEALTLANALYSLYKDQRQQADSYESQIRAAITTKPLTDRDIKKILTMLKGEE